MSPPDEYTCRVLRAGPLMISSGTFIELAKRRHDRGVLHLRIGIIERGEKNVRWRLCRSEFVQCPNRPATVSRLRVTGRGGQERTTRCAITAGGGQPQTGVGGLQRSVPARLELAVASAASC